MKPEDLPANIMKKKEWTRAEMGLEEIPQSEVGTSDKEKSWSIKYPPTDKEKLIRHRCAQSLFNISMDLKRIERMASGVCMIIAKGLIADLELPETAGTPQTVHDSNIPAEVEAMAEKIREEING